MCDFDDFDDFDNFCDNGLDDDFLSESGDAIADEPKDECEGWCFGDETADFAILGGILGFVEEAMEERRRLERELKKEEEECESCCKDPDPYDPYDPPDEEPYP
jgi:hypothetical protein